MKRFLPTLMGLLLMVPNLSGASILIVSDSHGAGAYGEELTRLLEQSGETVSFYAFGGTKPEDWIEGNNLTWGYWEHHSGMTDRRGTDRNTPKLTELLPLHQPHQVLISLGTNIVWRDFQSSDARNIRFLMNSVIQTGARCIWVGQPDLNEGSPENQNRNLELQRQLRLASAETGCQLIESWNFTNYPKNLGDGIHYDHIPLIGKSLARKWAQGVYSRIDLIVKKE